MANKKQTFGTDEYLVYDNVWDEYMNDGMVFYGKSEVEDAIAERTKEHIEGGEVEADDDISDNFSVSEVRNVDFDYGVETSEVDVTITLR